MFADAMQLACEVEITPSVDVVGAESTHSLYCDGVDERTTGAYPEALSGHREHADRTKIAGVPSLRNLMRLGRHAETSRHDRAELVDESWCDHRDIIATHVTKQRFDPVTLDEFTVLVQENRHGRVASE